MGTMDTLDDPKILWNGDIGLVRTGAGLSGKLVQLAAWLRLIPRQRYQHAFIVGWKRVSSVRKEPHLIEASWKVRERPVTERDLELCDFVRVKANYVIPALKMRRGAATYAYKMVGSPYGVWALVVMAWDTIRSHLRGESVRVAKAYICTEVVAMSWLNEGIRLVGGVLSAKVLPDMLADSPKVERVEGLEWARMSG